MTDDDRRAVADALERILDAETLDRAQAEAVFALGLLEVERLRALARELTQRTQPAVRDAANIAASMCGFAEDGPMRPFLDGDEPEDVKTEELSVEELRKRFGEIDLVGVGEDEDSEPTCPECPECKGDGGSIAPCPLCGATREPGPQ